MASSPRYRNLHLCALMLMASALSSPSSARPVHEHWAAVQAQLAKNAGMVAHRVTTQFELPGDDGPASGTYTTIVRSVPPGGEPARELEIDTADGRMGLKMAPLDLGFGTSLANHPERLFSRIDSAQLAGTEQRGTRRLQVFDIRARPSTGNALVKATIWADERTANVLEMKGSLLNGPLPGVKSVDFAVTYQAGDEGLSLPANVTVTYTMSILFRTGTASFMHKLGGWARR